MGHLEEVGLIITPLKIIEQSAGSVMHGIKASEKSFKSFGEAYLSNVNYQMIKGWKLHKEMTLNLIVPVGEIRFIVHNSKKSKQNQEILPLIDVVLGNKNYSRLSVPPGLWIAFQGVSRGTNILLNIASMEHEPEEAINQPIDFFKVKGFSSNA